MHPASSAGWKQPIGRCGGAGAVARLQNQWAVRSARPDYNNGAMSAPRVLISYSHDSPEHKDRILALSDRLRAEGIDCSIDQYEESPSEGWPRWCEKQVEQSEFVLVACTETYL